MKRIEILIGSTLGNAEYLAEHIAEQLDNTEICLHEKPNFTDLSTDQIWLIVTSTHGAGECPENIQFFLDQLKDQTESLHSLQYAIVALGDKNYDTFCLAGKQFDDQLQRLNAGSLLPMMTVDAQKDLLPEEQIVDWLSHFKDQLH